MSILTRTHAAALVAALLTCPACVDQLAEVEPVVDLPASFPAPDGGVPASVEILGRFDAFNTSDACLDAPQAAIGDTDFGLVSVFMGDGETVEQAVDRVIPNFRAPAARLGDVEADLVVVTCLQPVEVGQIRLLQNWMVSNSLILDYYFERNSTLVMPSSSSSSIYAIRIREDVVTVDGRFMGSFEGDGV